MTILNNIALTVIKWLQDVNYCITVCPYSKSRPGRRLGEAFDHTDMAVNTFLRGKQHS